MKLYYAPGTCSIGIHILLEEIGKPYELAKLDFSASEQLSPKFKQINPKSKVPTLVRDDGAVLTEFQSIAYWLAQSNPSLELLPSDPEARIKCLSLADYVVGTIHPQAFGRQFRPANFAMRAEDIDAVKARGRELATNAFAIVDGMLGDGECVTERFSFADAALFYVEFWQVGRLGLKLPKRCMTHYEAMLGRNSVKTVLQREGFA